MRGRARKPECLTRTQKVTSSNGPGSHTRTGVFRSRRSSRGVGDRWGTSKHVLLTLRWVRETKKPCDSARPSEISYYNSPVEIHPSARKHGIADEDIEHAMRNALAIYDQDEDIRLYLGPARSADLLEIVTVVRDEGSELAIHAMKMRPGYARLLPEL